MLDIVESTNAKKENTLAAARDVFQKIAENIARIMQGQAGATRRLLAALASGGHVLLEDYPGTGKTTLAKALAKSVAARIRQTPWVLLDFHQETQSLEAVFRELTKES